MCRGEGRWSVRLSGRWRGERASAEREGMAVRVELVEPASEGGPVGYLYGESKGDGCACAFPFPLPLVVVAEAPSGER